MFMVTARRHIFPNVALNEVPFTVVLMSLSILFLSLSLPFTLLSDPELQAIQAYGVWQEKKLYGKVSMGVVRTTFLIDENGCVEKVMPKVKPDTNAQEILDALSAAEEKDGTE